MKSTTVMMIFFGMWNFQLEEGCKSCDDQPGKKDQYNIPYPVKPDHYNIPYPLRPDQYNIPYPVKQEEYIIPYPIIDIPMNPVTEQYHCDTYGVTCYLPPEDRCPRSRPICCINYNEPNKKCHCFPVKRYYYDGSHKYDSCFFYTFKPTLDVTGPWKQIFKR